MCTLAGCLHTQLNGSLAGATISIAELRNPEAIVLSTTSADDAQSRLLYGEET